MLCPQPENFVAIVRSNGPDIRRSGYQNFYYRGRLWRDFNLTRLSSITYPAERSAFNSIEHAWCPLSNALTGVTLPLILPGRDKPPHKQTYVCNKEWELKEEQTLDTAANKLATYWNSISFDDNAVVPIAIPSLGGKLIYKDHPEIETFINAPLRDLKTVFIFC